MKDKLILKVYKPQTRTGEQNIVRIDRIAMDALVELQRATGLPLTQLASKMITFASEHTEIVEE